VKVTEYLISLPIVGGISAVVGFFCGARLGFQAGRWRRYAERGKALGADPMMTWPVIQYYDALDELGTVLNIDHQAKPSGEGGYASKWEYGNAYKRHYARASWQLERVGGKDGLVGLVSFQGDHLTYYPRHPSLLYRLVRKDSPGKAEVLAAKSIHRRGERPGLGLAGSAHCRSVQYRTGDHTIVGDVKGLPTF
jgi:hypothetical protein